MSQNPFDPARFDLRNASAELRAGVAQLEAMRIPMLDHVLTSEEAKEMRRAGVIPGMPAAPPPQREPVVRAIQGPAGRLELRCFQPKSGRPRATMLHIHGGGWFTGSADMMDIALERRADALDIAIASVEYRLAPEHPYPAAPDDCEAAAAWLAKNARAELGADLALVGGESAGGHLSAVTVVRMRDRHGFAFAGANLVYGIYDLGGVPSHTQYDGRNLLLDGPSLEVAISMFQPEYAKRRNPDASPLYANLAGLCPALFTVGTLDPLRDHTLFMYAEWIAQGSPAEIQIFPGGPHGFDMFPCAEQVQAHGAIDAFLARCLDGSFPKR
jgi:acetyl esterase/lipase